MYDVGFRIMVSSVAGRDYAQNCLGRTAGRAAYSLLKADRSKYGLEVTIGDSLAEKLMVPIKNR